MTSKKARWDEVDEGRTAGEIIKMKEKRCSVSHYKHRNISGCQYSYFNGRICVNTSLSNIDNTVEKSSSRNEFDNVLRMEVKA